MNARISDEKIRAVLLLIAISGTMISTSLGLSFTTADVPISGTISKTIPQNWCWPTSRNNTSPLLDFLAWNPTFEGWHLAEDYALAQGSPVYALASGEVVLSRTDVGGYGAGGAEGGALVARYQTITGEYFTALYGHLDNPHVTGKVARGEILGYSNSYDPSHLHFGIRLGFELADNPWMGYSHVKGETYGFVDPTQFLRSNSPVTTSVVAHPPQNWYGFSIGTTTYPHVTYEGWAEATDHAVNHQWDFTVHRVVFYFKKDYQLIPREELWKQIDDCLRAIDEAGAEAVLDCHNYWNPDNILPDGTLEGIGYRNVLCGSKEWFTEYWALVERFKDDPRILGWEIFNEPYYSKGGFLDPAYRISLGYPDTIQGRSEALMKAQYEMSVGIRQRDNLNRPIIWAGRREYYGAGVTPKNSPITHTDYTQLIQNIIISIHPYSNLNPDGTVADTWEELMVQWKGRLNDEILPLSQYYPVWFGEIECHAPSDKGAASLVLEEKYVSFILNYAITHGHGFAIWKYPSMDYVGADADRVLEASGYGFIA